MDIVVVTLLITGLVLAPLGCLVMWKRYVYYSDGVAHASMLAAAISVVLGIPILYAGVANAMIFAVIVFKLKNTTDSTPAIGLASSIMMSCALILSYVMPGSFEFNSLLFGDIIAATEYEAMTLFGMFLAVGVFFIATYRDLIFIILSRDVAHSRGVNLKMTEFLFLTILSCAIICSIKVVGALLVTSIILIPAMTARIVTNSPKKMMFFSIVFAEIMNICGIIISYNYDLPVSPVIVLAGAIIFFLTKFISSSMKARKNIQTLT